jgi:hypothetical protein
MADDIVAIGGSGAAERFEALFRAEYENVVAASGCSERQVQQAFLRLWRRRWLVRDTRVLGGTWDVTPTAWPRCRVRSASIGPGWSSSIFGHGAGAG